MGDKDDDAVSGGPGGGVEKGDDDDSDDWEDVVVSNKPPPKKRAPPKKSLKTRTKTPQKKKAVPKSLKGITEEVTETTAKKRGKKQENVSVYDMEIFNKYMSISWWLEIVRYSTRWKRVMLVIW